MERMEWIAPCHFGLESVLKREIQDLGYEIAQVEDGRVTFYGGALNRLSDFFDILGRIAFPIFIFLLVSRVD